MLCARSRSVCETCGGSATWCSKNSPGVVMKRYDRHAPVQQESRSQLRLWTVGFLVIPTVAISVAAGVRMWSRPASWPRANERPQMTELCSADGCVSPLVDDEAADSNAQIA